MIFRSKLNSGKTFIIVGVNIPDKIQPIKQAIKNKINNIEKQFIDSQVSLNSIKIINSLNLHKAPFVPVSFSNSFEILNNNVYK